MSLINLKDLYPIGIDESKATEEAVKRFERWKVSKNFACPSEQRTFESFPRLFLKPGERHFGKVSFRSDLISECTEAYEWEYPLQDGRLVIKRVAWITLVNGGNIEFGNQFPESMYFFHAGDRLLLEQGDHMVFGHIREMSFRNYRFFEEFAQKCHDDSRCLSPDCLSFLEKRRLVKDGEVRPFVRPFVLRRIGLKNDGHAYFITQK